jgi:hypothetical protein
MTPIAVSTFVWVFILVPLIVVWAIGIVDIVRRDMGAGVKAAWIILVLVLPLVGTLLYFLLRKPSEEEIRQSYAASRALEGDRPGIHQRLPDD